MNIYWTVDHSKVIGSLRAKEIEPIYKNLFKNRDISKLGYNKCPSFKNYFNNVYGWKSIYTYEMREENGKYKTDLYDQKFFDRHISVRSVEEKLISFYQYLNFITDSPSLELSVEHPYFEENKFTKTCYVIPGILDIGKYYRHLDFAFHIKKEFNSFSVNEGDIIYYLRFHTKEKLNFKQYYMTDRLREYRDMINNIKEFTMSAPRPISYFYDIYKKSNLKNKILKEIKENLV